MVRGRRPRVNYCSVQVASRQKLCATFIQFVLVYVFTSGSYIHHSSPAALLVTVANRVAHTLTSRRACIAPALTAALSACYRSIRLHSCLSPSLALPSPPLPSPPLLPLSVMGGGNGCKSAAKREKNMAKLQKAGKKTSQKDAVKNQPVSLHHHAHDTTSTAPRTYHRPTAPHPS